MATTTLGNSDVRLVARNKNFCGFQNPIQPGVDQSYEYVLQQLNSQETKRWHGLSKGLKTQKYYDVKHRLKEKLEARKNT